jgi:hypothetical protein
VKICTKCGTGKPLDQFGPHRGRRDGLNSWCRACANGQSRDYRQAHPELHREAQRRYKQANYAVFLAKLAAQRAAVFDHYGRTCACCGVTGWLTIDHVNGDGKDRRLQHGRGGRFYRWLIRSGFPDGFQTLCFPCNRSKDTGERCQLDHAEKVT